MRDLKWFASVGWKNKHQRSERLRQLAQKTGDVAGQLQGRITNPCEPYYPREKIQK
jgi:hypothetical protein